VFEPKDASDEQLAQAPDEYVVVVTITMMESEEVRSYQ
jgi:hypothetical protein